MKPLPKLISAGSFLLLIQWHAVFSQNLIPNPGFEVYDTCPNQLLKTALFWKNIEGHADYYNSCAPLNITSVPNNYFGHQLAHSGCGYEGLFCFDYHTENYREILQARLDSTLLIGSKYYLSFNLNLGDATNRSWTGTNKFGCKLSVNSFGNGLTDGSPAIDNTANFFTDSIVTDTVTWVYISGSFIADSTYNYIAFGCFFDSAHVQYSDTGSHLITYYYIDDVCLSSDSTTCISVSQNCYTPNGIDEQEEKHNLVYPNPFNDELKISMGSQQLYTLQLYNVFGAKVLIQTFTLSASINTAMLAPGIYCYKIINSGGEMWSGKLLKE